MRSKVRRAADRMDLEAAISKPKPASERKTRKRTKSERRQLEAALDKTVSEYVRKRDGRCVICGATEGLTAGHWIARGKKRIRWHLKNVNCQCRSCNLAHNYNPQFYTMYMLRKYGPQTLETLTAMSAEKAYKFSVVDLRAMLAEIKAISEMERA